MDRSQLASFLKGLFARRSAASRKRCALRLELECLEDRNLPNNLATPSDLFTLALPPMQDSTTILATTAVPYAIADAPLPAATATLPMADAVPAAPAAPTPSLTAPVATASPADLAFQLGYLDPSAGMFSNSLFANPLDTASPTPVSPPQGMVPSGGGGGGSSAPSASAASSAPAPINTSSPESMSAAPTYPSTAAAPAASAATQQVSTTIWVTSSSGYNNPTSAPGQSVTFTVNISGGLGNNGTPGGTVQFYDNGVPLGDPAAVGPAAYSMPGSSQAQATLTTSALAAGTHDITASYSGDAVFAASNTAGPLTQTVQQVSTTTWITSSSGDNNPTSAPGQSVTFTANISGGLANNGTPGGTVQFFDNGVALGDPAAVGPSAYPMPGSSQAQATLTTSALSAGADIITATYSGDAVFAASAANPVTQTVQQEMMWTNLTGEGADLAAWAGTPTGPVDVGNFVSSNGQVTAANFTATISWGDGQTSAGVVQASGGEFAVLGSHTYDDAGADAITVAIGGGQTLILTGTATVSLPTTGMEAVAGTAFSGAIASFGPTTSSAVSATIDWGDGQTSAGAIQTASDGSFTVNGAHTYAAVSDPTVTVTVQLASGGTAMASGPVIVADPATSGQGDNLSGTAGQMLADPSVQDVVATFTDPNPQQPLGDFTAIDDWGDGTTSMGTVQAAAGGGLAVLDDHAYATAGDYLVTTNLIDNSAQTHIAYGAASVAPPLGNLNPGPVDNALGGTAGTYLIGHQAPPPVAPAATNAPLVKDIVLDRKTNAWTNQQGPAGGWQPALGEQQRGQLGAWNDPHTTGDITFGLWVVIFGQNLSHLDAGRYASGTTVVGGHAEMKGAGYGGAKAKTPENMNTDDAPEADDVWVNAAGTIMIVADMPGLFPIQATGYPVRFDANFEVVLTSDLDNQVKGRIWYDYNMAANAAGPAGVTANGVTPTDQIPAPVVP